MFKEQIRNRDARTAAAEADHSLYKTTQGRRARGESLSADEQLAFAECCKRMGVSDRERDADLAALIRDEQLGRQLSELWPLLESRKADERAAMSRVALAQHELNSAKEVLYLAAAARSEISDLQLQRARARSAAPRVYMDSESLAKRRDALRNY